MKVILDTNFLIYCAKQKIDYAEEIGNLLNRSYELVVPFQVLNELRKLKLKAKKGKDKEAAALALQILELKKIVNVKISGKTADEAIFNLANQDRDVVCTADEEMRGKLRRVILIRGKRLVLIKY